jgi:uncharacterized protein YggL (DUF469 family)
MPAPQRLGREAQQRDQSLRWRGPGASVRTSLICSSAVKDGRRNERTQKSAWIHFSVVRDLQTAPTETAFWKQCLRRIGTLCPIKPQIVCRTNGKTPKWVQISLQLKRRTKEKLILDRFKKTSLVLE